MKFVHESSKLLIHRKPKTFLKELYHLGLKESKDTSKQRKSLSLKLSMEKKQTDISGEKEKVSSENKTKSLEGRTKNHL